MTMPVEAFINPFLVCTSCTAAVIWHKDDRITNHPCGHQGVRSVCMTWSPATGCTCKERFGVMPHAGPSTIVQLLPPAKPATAAASTTPAAAAPKP